MDSVFVLIEQTDSVPDDTTLELAAIASRLVGESGRIVGVALGDAISDSIAGIAGWFDEIYVWDDSRLSVPDGEQTAAIIRPLIDREAPELVLAAHTNNAMDFVPGLSIRLDRPLITDCLSVSKSGATLSTVRPVYGGKIHARSTLTASANGYIVTVRPGAVPVAGNPSRRGDVKPQTLDPDITLRRRIVGTVAADAADVDISQAEKLVAVGRGIDDEESLDMIRSLADVMGAEIACSRPVVDKQWLPKSRQVGTSGRTVRPKVYIAIGISGSFQHMGGIKGDPFLVAINKDPRAPIFSMADVGIVGDLFDVIPELIERIKATAG